MGTKYAAWMGRSKERRRLAIAKSQAMSD